MRMLLWPGSSPREQLEELDRAMSTGMSGTLPGVILVAEIANEAASGELIGFLEAGLRSHADGCDTAQPVGFVEGWFVRQVHRNRGVGRRMMGALEVWAREQG